MMNDQSRHITIKDDKPERIAFLLRLWCEDQTGHSIWRASLETPGTGKRIGFASLEQLFIYLIDLSENRNDIQEKENDEDRWQPEE